MILVIVFKVSSLLELINFCHGTFSKDLDHKTSDEILIFQNAYTEMATIICIKYSSGTPCLINLIFIHLKN